MALGLPLGDVKRREECADNLGELNVLLLRVFEWNRACHLQTSMCMPAQKDSPNTVESGHESDCIMPFIRKGDDVDESSISDPWRYRFPILPDPSQPGYAFV